MMNAILLALVCLAALSVPATAQLSAAPVQCQLAATPLSFGRYLPSVALPDDSTATLTVTCFTASPVPIPVRATVGLAAASAVQELQAAGKSLRYRLYVDAGRTVAWGDGNGGTAPLLVSGIVSRGSPLRQQVTVYGRILAQQKTTSVGGYSGQLNVMLSY